MQKETIIGCAFDEGDPGKAVKILSDEESSSNGATFYPLRMALLL